MKDKREISLEFGGHIKELRDENGLSLARVKELTGISPSYLSKLENGKRLAPTVPIIFILSQVYQVSVIELFEISLNIYIEEDTE